MNLDVEPPNPLNLDFEVSAERPNRKVLVQQPCLKVVQLTLAPGQALPLHRHPGCSVLLQGLTGSVTVQLEEKTTLAPQQLLGFSGDSLVSLHNDSAAPSALLVTLVTPNEEKR